MVARHAARSAKHGLRAQRVAVWGSLGAVIIAVVAVGSANVLTSGDHASTSTTTSAVATTTTTTTTTTLATASLSAVGDTELGNSPQLPADPTAYLLPIKSALAAPIVVGNLEGTMTSATTSKCAPTSTHCFAFQIPTSYARAYRNVGFTVLNSANNHSHDFGAQGTADTSAALADAGIAQAGLPGQIAIVREGSLKVAVVGVAPYAVTNDLLNLVSAAQLIAEAQRRANLVVVYMHAGAEGTMADHVSRATETYVGENRGNPYAFAHMAIDHGADLVIASGPHVLRAMEWYRGHLIAYSLGDFANFYDFSSAGSLRLSGILHVTLDAHGAFVAGHFTSLSLSPSGQPFVDPTGAAAAFVNQHSTADFGATGALINRRGEIKRPT